MLTGREKLSAPTAIPQRSTAEQLRHDIDSGRTGDKVRASDPAAAPLGTDEEAAGTPVDPSVISAARRSEQSLPEATPAQRGPGAAWILIAFVLFGALGILCLALL